MKELTEKHGELANGLKESVDEVIGEFSLDKPDSALSRLVGQVESAQRKISSEFSLDEQNSALARMKKELEQLIEKSNKENDEFRAHVRASLAALAGAQGGIVQVHAARARIRAGGLSRSLAESGQAAGDVVEHTAGTTGLIKNCKVGDVVLTLGPEHAAAGSRIVVEAKQDASYRLARCADGDRAGAQEPPGVTSDVFVFSKRTCGRADRAARPLRQRRRASSGTARTRRATSS